MSETLAILNQYPPDKYNVLAPESMSTITPWHQVIVSKVKISANPNDGEVYPQSGKLALTKIGLLRLSDVAGIRWQRPTFERDDDGSVDCIAVLERQDVDGSWRQYPGSYRWDVTERLKECDMSTDKGKKEARMIRTFATQRAESGAMERAIRGVLQLKATYTPTELSKPFVVARVSFNPYSDPLVQAAFRQALTVNLLHNLDLMRGPEGGDVLGIDGPAPANRVSDGQLQAARAVLSLADGNDDDSNGGQAGSAELAPEDSDVGQPTVLPAPPDPLPTDPTRMLAAVNQAIGPDEQGRYYYQHMMHALNTLGLKTWPPAKAVQEWTAVWDKLIHHAIESRAEQQPEQQPDPLPGLSL